MQPDPRAFRAWLVDLDGTLYHARPLKLAMGAELLLLGARDLRPVRAFRRAHERLREELCEPVDSPFHLQLERALAEAGCDATRLEACVRRWMIERPARWLRLFRRRGLLREIEAFRAAGGRTALVSDYPARAKLTALGLAGSFEVVVAAGEPDGPRRLKPWPDGYLAAAERLGVPPGDCLVLGDRRDADGLAAERAGMAFRLVPAARAAR